MGVEIEEQTLHTIANPSKYDNNLISTLKLDVHCTCRTRQRKLTPAQNIYSVEVSDKMFKISKNLKKNVILGHFTLSTKKLFLLQSF